VPLLDHRLIEFAGRLPMDFKQRDGSSKAVLRQVLARYVPPALTERPKMGFGVPVGLWLRGPLRNWAESLFDADSLARDGLLDVALVRRMWHEHLSRQREWQYQLWAVLMFQSWRRHQSQSVLARAA
jgi:asparagine synthase (glutamine-hydrolysing)